MQQLSRATVPKLIFSAGDPSKAEAGIGGELLTCNALVRSNTNSQDAPTRGAEKGAIFRAVDSVRAMFPVVTKYTVHTPLSSICIQGQLGGNSSAKSQEHLSHRILKQFNPSAFKIEIDYGSGLEAGCTTTGGRDLK